MTDPNDGELRRLLEDALKVFDNVKPTTGSDVKTMLSTYLEAVTARQTGVDEEKKRMCESLIHASKALHIPINTDTPATEQLNTVVQGVTAAFEARDTANYAVMNALVLNAAPFQVQINQSLAPAEYAKEVLTDVSTKHTAALAKIEEFEKRVEVMAAALGFKLTKAPGREQVKEITNHVKRSQEKKEQELVQWESQVTPAVNLAATQLGVQLPVHGIAGLVQELGEKAQACFKDTTEHQKDMFDSLLIEAIGIVEHSIGGYTVDELSVALPVLSGDAASTLRWSEQEKKRITQATEKRDADFQTRKVESEQILRDMIQRSYKILYPHANSLPTLTPKHTSQQLIEWTTEIHGLFQAQLHEPIEADVDLIDARTDTLILLRASLYTFVKNAFAAAHLPTADEDWPATYEEDDLVIAVDAEHFVAERLEVLQKALDAQRETDKKSNAAQLKLLAAEIDHITCLVCRCTTVQDPIDFEDWFKEEFAEHQLAIKESTEEDLHFSYGRLLRWVGGRVFDRFRRFQSLLHKEDKLETFLFDATYLSYDVNTKNATTMADWLIEKGENLEDVIKERSSDAMEAQQQVVHLRGVLGDARDYYTTLEKAIDASYVVVLAREEEIAKLKQLQAPPG
ncbi:uncharacterized protein J4E79_006001 [Alternaria viburni]|uniref:uncharacterized protein n=1 Tax=Alternaria viburni TaxID=566460 RepID=UPI0020C53964|nr:uncharacterized protein J4E79_006001 [Alternaria viburni]KAI4660196.1 hypothetical protein J4E79_006001 [Alternaria viburni]